MLWIVKKLQVARSGLNKMKKLPQILKWYLKPIAAAMDPHVFIRNYGVTAAI